MKVLNQFSKQELWIRATYLLVMRNHCVGDWAK